MSFESGSFQGKTVSVLKQNAQLRALPDSSTAWAKYFPSEFSNKNVPLY